MLARQPLPAATSAEHLLTTTSLATQRLLAEIQAAILAESRRRVAGDL